jgi:acetyltransferase-like isoleucine patch superfamily enzyme
MIGKLFFHLIEDIIRNISGPIGLRLRRIYYKSRLGGAGYKLVIDTGVSFQNPKEIFLGNQVWIDKNCVFIAGKIKPESGSIVRKTFSGTDTKEGCIQLGSFSHIGIGTIIQGHGGVSAGDCFTSSAGCRIYSFSNDYRTCHDGTVESPAGKPGYIMGPVTIGRNVWIGLGVSVISTEIGDDCFILPHAVVYEPLEKNLVAGGNPAVKSRDRFHL